MSPHIRRTYSHISLEERRKIERWRAAKVSVDVMAEKLGRHRSTVFRELRRNRFHDPLMPTVRGYFGVAADLMTRQRRHDRRKLVRFPGLREAIIERIHHGWSPEQIAGRLRLEWQGSAGRQFHWYACPETIYRFAHSKDGQAIQLWRHLPERRARRRPRYARRHRPRCFLPELSILNRPDAVRLRQEFGHWECDLLQFRKRYGTANLTSLVERTSRFTVFLRNNDRHSRPIIDSLIRTLAPLPYAARRSITFDRGTEFTDWPHLQAGLGVQPWFCDPQSPWQKVTVENTNRRARRWLNRDVDPLTLAEPDLRRICDHLNSTPRKCLGYRTPAEVFRNQLMASERDLR